MDNNEITLEKIELVKDRTGISYKEAKEALEEANGNVVDAIIAVEEKIDLADGGAKDPYAKRAVEAIKDVIRRGNVNKLSIKKDGETILNLPINAGIIGTLIFPWAAVTGIIAAFGTRCSIELVKEGGEVVDISNKAEAALNAAVSKGEVIFDEAKDKGRDIYEAVKDKSGDIIDYAKDKAQSIAERVKTKEPMPSDNLDLSDLDLSEMGEREPAEGGEEKDNPKNEETKEENE